MSICVVAYLKNCTVVATAEVSVVATSSGFLVVDSISVTFALLVGMQYENIENRSNWQMSLVSIV